MFVIGREAFLRVRAFGFTWHLILNSLCDSNRPTSSLEEGEKSEVTTALAFSCVSSRISHKNTAGCVYLPKIGGLQRVVTGILMVCRQDLFLDLLGELAAEGFTSTRSQVRDTPTRCLMSE